MRWFTSVLHNLSNIKQVLRIDYSKKWIFFYLLRCRQNLHVKLVSLLSSHPCSLSQSLRSSQKTLDSVSFATTFPRSSPPCNLAAPGSALVRFRQTRWSLGWSTLSSRRSELMCECFLSTYWFFFCFFFTSHWIIPRIANELAKCICTCWPPWAPLICIHWEK